jgi:hypothetical protein
MSMDLCKATEGAYQPGPFVSQFSFTCFEERKWKQVPFWAGILYICFYVVLLLYANLAILVLGQIPYKHDRLTKTDREKIYDQE